MESKGSSSAHSILVNETLLELGKNRKDMVISKNHVGVAYTKWSVDGFILKLKKIFSMDIINNFKPIPIKFGVVGSADIEGIYRTGKKICFECKTGSAKQSKVQLNYEKMVLSMKGYYFVIRSIEDVKNSIKYLKEKESDKN